MNEVTTYALYSPVLNKYYSKIHSKSEYLFRDLDTVRLYTSLDKLSDTLVELRRRRPDIVPIPITLSHEVDGSFTRPQDRVTIDLDPIANEAITCRKEFEGLQEQDDTDADKMSVRNWKRYRVLKQFYRNNGYASFDRTTKKLTWVKEFE